MSKLLTDKYQEYKDAYKRAGAVIEVVDAFIALTKYALFTEKEIDLGLEISDMAIEVINEYIKKETKGA
ncbi:MAG: hypothetical protein IKE41_00950, partial [Clostridia bacterium]|nr:hypothetical protein [Clostridia bacterium]